MYSETLALNENYVLALGYFKDGTSTVILPWEVLPIDYYKTKLILTKLYLETKRPSSKEERTKFAKILGRKLERKDLIRLDFIKIKRTEENLKDIYKTPNRYTVIFSHTFRKADAL
jgi:hypothetical protein